MQIQRQNCFNEKILIVISVKINKKRKEGDSEQFVHGDE